MAETLLIVFVVFVVLGMPIGIALGVGTLAAATLFTALNPIVIPSRFVALLSDCGERFHCRVGDMGGVCIAGARGQLDRLTR